MIDFKDWFICSIVFSFISLMVINNTTRQGPESIAYGNEEYRKKYQREVGFRNHGYRISMDILVGYVWWVILFLLVNELAAVPQSENARAEVRAYNDKVSIPVTCSILSREEFKYPCGATCVKFVFDVEYKNLKENLIVNCEDLVCIKTQRELNSTMTCYSNDINLFVAPPTADYFRPGHFIVMRWIIISIYIWAIVMYIYGRFVQVPDNKNWKVSKIDREPDDEGYTYTLSYEWVVPSQVEPERIVPRRSSSEVEIVME